MSANYIQFSCSTVSLNDYHFIIENMYRTVFLIVVASALLLQTSCVNEEIDKEIPVIDLSIPGAFPISCDTLWFGEPFRLKMRFTDNVQLGSINAFSLSVHHNFNHHSHSTEITACNLAPVKVAVNPFVFIESYTLPAGLKEWETDIEITVPRNNENGVFDEGDYHFFVSLADNEGWTAQKGISIKMLYR